MFFYNLYFIALAATSLFVPLVCGEAFVSYLGTDPDILLITSSQNGIHAYNYFSIANYDFRYSSIYINGQRLPSCNLVDQEHNDIALDALRARPTYNEIFTRTYKFPDLPTGNHQLRLVFYKSASSVSDVHVTVDVVCHAMELVFYPRLPTPAICHIKPESSILSIA